MSVETAAAEAPASAGATTTSEPTPVTIVETPEASLEDDLSAVWDSVNAEETGEGEETGPIRGPDGKFAKRDGAETAAEGEETEQAAAEETGSEATSGEESEAGQSEGEEAETAETLSIDPPQSWPAEMKERFSALPPEFRDVAEFAAQRDKEQGDAISRIGQEFHAVEQRLGQYEPIGKVIEAYKDEFDRRGIQPAQGISTLLQAQRMLDSNPLGGLVEIGRSYGIDLMPLLNHHGVQVQRPQPEQPPQVDPNVARLESELQELKSKMTAQERAAHEAEEKQLNQTIAEFAKDKPYFKDVAPIMATLLQGEQATDLATAYEMAIHASPKTRERIQADARKAEQAKRDAEAKAKAEQARKSTAVNVKSGPSGSPNPKTMDDDLAEIARRHYG